MFEFSQANIKWFLKRVILDHLILLTTRSAVFLLLILAVGLGPVHGLPVCETGYFLLRYAGNCEPCSTICDPPAVYETDCAKYCPDYQATPTPPPGPEEPAGLPAGLVVLISVSVVVGLFALAFLGYRVWRAWARLVTFVQPCLPMMARDNTPVQEQCQTQSDRVTDDGYQSLGSTTPEDNNTLSDDEDETRALDEIANET